MAVAVAVYLPGSPPGPGPRSVHSMPTVNSCLNYRAQNSSRPSAIFRAFQPDAAAQATSWSVTVSRQNFPKLYNYQYGLDRNIYSHLYSLLEFYLTFYIKKWANKLLCSYSCYSFDFSVAKRDTCIYDKSKCNCCARCPRVSVVKLIDLICDFLVQPSTAH